MKLLSPLLLAAAASTAYGAVQKVTRVGRYMYTTDGNRLYVKRIAYQTQDNPLDQPSTFVDNLTDSAGCARDLPFLQQLGVNASRAHSVDSTLNHDSCMAALSGVGIYVMCLLDQHIETINVFSKYDNVLVYNVGNEVLTASAMNVAPFIKAAARDVKAYLASISSSALVGYADIDDASGFHNAVAQCDLPVERGGEWRDEY
ncbi:Glucanosyltransferase-domain-containing protein [Mycena sanguinolenta]|nr:Glucanosyltransferase-domain-containing protein [Mycena sanguinolenta]